MRRLVGTAMVTASGLAFGLAIGGGQADARVLNFDHEHVPGQLIVNYEEGVQPELFELAIQDLGAQTTKPFKTINSRKVEFFAESMSTEQLRKRAEQIAAMPGVKSVETNQIIRLQQDQVFPNDSRFGELYGLHNTGQSGGTEDADIDAPEAWTVSTGSREVVVGVIDTGIDYNHPDLVDNMWTNPGETGLDASGNDKSTNGVDDDGNGYVDDFRGWDFANNDNDPFDDNRHGTHCAGTIGGTGNNSDGVAGVNWEVSMVGIKFLTGGGSGTSEGAIQSIEYATTIGVDLTSNSWGGGGFSEAMESAIVRAKDNGILFVAAAGNSRQDNDRSPTYPATYDVDNIIAVAATDRNDAMASFSSFGATTVDVAAPGVDVVSTVPGNSYESLSGTSMATPHVAGVAALIKAVYPEADWAKVRSRIINTVDPLPALSTKVAAGGRVNAFNALENDTVAPGAITDVSVTARTTTSVDLSWAAAGDDGDQGTAARYEVRFSSNPINDLADWEAATVAKTESLTSDSADVIARRISGFALNFEGHVAVRAVDNVGNQGEVSGSSEFAVAKVELVMENDAETLDGTTPTGSWGLEDSPTRNGKVFTESPNGQYANNLNISLTFDPVAVTTDELTLAMISEYNIESGYDYFYIEVAQDGGEFQEVAKLSGARGWEQSFYDLSSFLNNASQVQVRFRFTTDGSVTRDGVRVDDLAIFAAVN